MVLGLFQVLRPYPSSLSLEHPKTNIKLKSFHSFFAKTIYFVLSDIFCTMCLRNSINNYIIYFVRQGRRAAELIHTYFGFPSVHLFTTFVRVKKIPHSGVKCCCYRHPLHFLRLLTHFVPDKNCLFDQIVTSAR